LVEILLSFRQFRDEEYFETEGMIGIGDAKLPGVFREKCQLFWGLHDIIIWSNRMTVSMGSKWKPRYPFWFLIEKNQEECFISQIEPIYDQAVQNEVRSVIRKREMVYQVTFT